MMQLDGDVALMHGEVLLEGGAGMCCKGRRLLASPLPISPSPHAHTQTCMGMKPSEATKDAAVLWVALWCVPAMALLWQKGRA